MTSVFLVFPLTMAWMVTMASSRATLQPGPVVSRASMTTLFGVKV